MSRKNIIPTPWHLKWRRFRHNVLPAIFFCACVGGMVWLWQGVAAQPNAVGKVEAVRVDVPAGADGLLQASPGNSWALFDRVESGQLLARLDDRVLKTSLQTLRLELEQLKAEISAAEIRSETEYADRMRDHQQEAIRLTWQVERSRLEMLDRTILVETEQLEVDRLTAELEFISRAGHIVNLSELDLEQRRFVCDEAAKRLELNRAVLAESEEQWIDAQEDLTGHPPVALTQTERLLAPLQTSLTVCESRIRELKLQIRCLDIRAPISGTICSINCWPGQNVQAADPIVSLAADEGRYIVSYIRQKQDLRPEPGMPVALNLRQVGAQPVETVIENVGSQIEPIPLHHLRDPNTPEWGQPVRITPPAGLGLRPGELVDITFSTERAACATSRSGTYANP
jgi:multidrug resistance efflux pump